MTAFISLVVNANYYDNENDEVLLIAREVRDIRYLIPGITCALAQGPYGWSKLGT